MEIHFSTFTFKKQHIFCSEVQLVTLVHRFTQTKVCDLGLTGTHKEIFHNSSSIAY